MTFYRFARAVVLSVCKVVFRVRVVGREHVPPDGAYIVAPTHRSGFDVPFAAFVTTRTIRFLAKEELFVEPLLDVALLDAGRDLGGAGHRRPGRDAGPRGRTP